MNRDILGGGGYCSKIGKQFRWKFRGGWWSEVGFKVQQDHSAPDPPYTLSWQCTNYCCSSSSSIPWIKKRGGKGVKPNTGEQGSPAKGLTKLLTLGAGLGEMVSWERGTHIYIHPSLLQANQPGQATRLLPHLSCFSAINAEGNIPKMLWPTSSLLYLSFWIWRGKGGVLEVGRQAEVVPPPNLMQLSLCTIDAQYRISQCNLCC